ncbi:MAG: ABC transporter permease [Promethearchaeota archaeon]
MSQKSMIKYIVRRILIMIPTLAGVLLLTFVLPRLMGGDPVEIMFPLETEQSVIDEKRRELGLDQPLIIQFIIYFINFFKGDWGVAVAGWAEGLDVLQWLIWMLPRTFVLAIIPTIIVPFFGIKLGITSAKNRNKPIDSLVRGIAVAGAAFPVFWTGMVLQVFSGIGLKRFTNEEWYFPITGFQDMTARNPPEYTSFRIIDCFIANEQLLLFNSIIHLILPVSCMILVSLAGTTRLTRTTMLEVLEQDYIRTARAKGCLEETVLNKHALRNAIMPVSGGIIMGFAMTLGGTLLIEQTFSMFGMGMTMFQAIMFRDYWMINGCALILAICVLSGTIVVDVVYTIIDPRIMY